jgi:hypothetical protein
MRDREVYIDAALRMLGLARDMPFDFDVQAEKWAVWSALDALDPEEPDDPSGFESRVEQWRRESRSAEAYARRMLVPRDHTGSRYVVASWWQHFARLCLGSSSTPQRARQTMLGAGWRMRPGDGRILVREPGATGRSLVQILYIVPAGWEDQQAADTA